MADTEDVVMDASPAAPAPADNHQEPARPDSGNATAESATDHPEPDAGAAAPADDKADDGASGAEGAPSSANMPQSGKAIKALGTAKKGAAKKKGQQAGGEGGKFQVGDLVLAKVKGYPDWPAILIDAKRAPDRVYSDQSKKTGQHLAIFLPDANYAWSRSSDLKHLTKPAITAFLADRNKKKDGNLREGYEIADDDAAAWVEEKLQEVEEEKREDAAAGEEEDQLEEDGEGEGAGEVDGGDKPGKRKRKSEGGAAGGAADAAKDKKAKKAKLSELAKKKKSAATVDEDDEMVDEAPAKKQPAKKAAKKDKAAPASAAAAPADTAADAEGDDPLANDPEAKRIKEWRHKLQRAFLSKTLPTAEEMPTYDELFKTIESYDGMTIEYLQHSKIGKVMKKIAALPNIPRNDELKITDRAGKFCEQWSTKLEGGSAKPVSSAKPQSQSNGTASKAEANGADEAAPAAAAPPTEASDAPAPAANGHAAEEQPAAAEEAKVDV